MESVTSAAQGEGLLDSSLEESPEKTQPSYSSLTNDKTQPFVEALAPSTPSTGIIPPEGASAPSPLLVEVSVRR